MTTFYEFFSLLFLLRCEVEEDGDHHCHNRNPHAHLDPEYPHGPRSHRIDRQDPMQFSIVQVFPTQEETDEADPRIEDDTQTAEKKDGLLTQAFLHLFNVVREAEEDEARPQDHPSLESSSRTAMAVGNDIEAIDLDERDEEPADRLDDDIMKM